MILGHLTGILSCSVIGWVVGWSIFEPESGIFWGTSLISGLLGAVLGRSSAAGLLLPALSGAAIGMYLAWGLSYWIFGEHSGGFGFMIILFGGILGLRFGSNPKTRNSERSIGTLLGALHIGFIGGGGISVIIWLFVFDGVKEQILLISVPIVIICALAGALIGRQIFTSD